MLMPSFTQCFRCIRLFSVNAVLSPLSLCHYPLSVTSSSQGSTASTARSVRSRLCAHRWSSGIIQRVEGGEGGGGWGEGWRIKGGAEVQDMGGGLYTELHKNKRGKWVNSTISNLSCNWSFDTHPRPLLLIAHEIWPRKVCLKEIKY